MTAKQSPGRYAPDGAKYGCPTNSSGTLVTISVSDTGSDKKNGSQAPDGSVYFTLTNGTGTLQ